MPLVSYVPISPDQTDGERLLLMNAWARFRADFAYRQGKMYRFWGHRSVQRMFYEAAVAAFTRALAFDPDWIDVLLDRGLIYWRELGQAARAIEDFFGHSASGPFARRCAVLPGYGAPSAGRLSLGGRGFTRRADAISPGSLAA